MVNLCIFCLRSKSFGSAPIHLKYVFFQGVLEKFDDIVVTIATGGTATGLAIGNYLTGSKLRFDIYLVHSDSL